MTVNKTILKIQLYFLKRRLKKEELNILNHIAPSMRNNLDELWNLYYLLKKQYQILITNNGEK